MRKTLGEIERLLVKPKSSRWNSWNLAELPSHLVKLHKVIGYLLHSVRALSSLWTFTFIPFAVHFHVLNHQLSPHGPSTLIPWAVCFHNLNRPLSPVRPSTLFFNPFIFWTIVHFLMDLPLYLRTVWYTPREFTYRRTVLFPQPQDFKHFPRNDSFSNRKAKNVPRQGFRLVQKYKFLLVAFLFVQNELFLSLLYQNSFCISLNPDLKRFEVRVYCVSLITWILGLTKGKLHDEIMQYFTVFLDIQKYNNKMH